jgi:hypothetical protein
LASTDQLQGAREELRELQSRISSGDTEFAVAELSVLRESIEELPRIDDLLRGIASAINALEGDDGADEVVMDVSAAVAAIDEGLAGSADELGWRQEINANTADAIVALEVGLRDTLGIRTQRRMTREQALYVASCNSGHTDVSLNF